MDQLDGAPTNPATAGCVTGALSNIRADVVSAMHDDVSAPHLCLDGTDPGRLDLTVVTGQDRAGRDRSPSAAGPVTSSISRHDLTEKGEPPCLPHGN